MVREGTRAGSRPNCGHFIRELAVSRRTLMRDLDFLRAGALPPGRLPRQLVPFGAQHSRRSHGNLCPLPLPIPRRHRVALPAPRYEPEADKNVRAPKSLRSDRQPGRSAGMACARPGASQQIRRRFRVLLVCSSCAPRVPLDCSTCTGCGPFSKFGGAAFPARATSPRVAVRLGGHEAALKGKNNCHCTPIAPTRTRPSRGPPRRLTVVPSIRIIGIYTS